MPSSTLSPFVVVHAGAHAPPQHEDALERAAAAGAAALAEGRTALDAAVEAVAALEADGRFNAGAGASVRLDGHTVEMDAACLDAAGRFGSVGALDGFLHPVRVARALVDTPHTCLVGEGARVFARRLDAEPADRPTDAAMERYDALRARLRSEAHEPSESEWARERLRDVWNFDASFYPLFGTPGSDAAERAPEPGAVGAIAWDGRAFAAATSTGGTGAALRGRVGEAIFPGAGLDASESGAVVASGSGEWVARTRVASRALALLQAGASPDDVLKEAHAWVPDHAALALLVVDAQGRVAGGGRTSLPFARRDAERAEAPAPPA